VPAASGERPPTPHVIAFPVPAYDPDLDRFQLTAKGEAYLKYAFSSP